MEECGEFDWDAVDADSSSAEIMQRSRQTNRFAPIGPLTLPDL